MLRGNFLFADEDLLLAVAKYIAFNFGVFYIKTDFSSEYRY